jgi:hypothetical protein
MLSLDALNSDATQQLVRERQQAVRDQAARLRRSPRRSKAGVRVRTRPRWTLI